MRRKFLSVVLCVCMMLTMAPFAFATEASSGSSSGGGIVTQAVAQIDNTTYNTLSDAITAAENGKTITLLSNTSGQVKIPANKDITLDLNGKTITHTGTTVYNSGKLTICDSSYDKSGKIISTRNVGVGVGHDSTTTIEYANIEAVEGAVITGYATGATITIKDGKFSASDNAVIAGNGNKTDDNATGNPVRVNPNKINILGGTFIGNIKTTGYIACGIYAPWKDIITVSGGNFTVNNGIGIVARAGQVTVTGGSFTCNGNAKGKVGDKNFDMDAAQSVYFDASNPAYPAYNSKTDYIKLLGGTFSSDVTKYVAENYTCIQNKDKYTVKALNDVAVAKIGDILYPTLTKAIEAVPDNGESATTVTLIKDSTENVTIPSGKSITLDLNGQILSGGTVASKATVTNNGTITIQDTSSSQTGKIIREDNGAKGYYTIDNQGTMTIKSGIVYNSTGNMPNGSSLIRNAGNNVAATLNITGGNIKQDGFIAVKNDDHGILNVSGGKITTTGDTITNTASAIQNWCTADITGGTINGAIWTSVWSNDLDNATTTIENATVLGRLICKKYDENGSTPPVSKTAKTIIKSGDFDISSWTVGNDCSVEISGGYFTSDPTSYLSTSPKAYTVASNKAGYSYMVTSQEPTKAPVIVKDDTNANLGSSITGDAKEAIETVIDKANIDGTAEAINAIGKAAILKDAAVTEEEQNNKDTKITIDVKVTVTATQANLSGNDSNSKSITFTATPVATVTVGTAQRKTDIKVDNSYLDGKEITVTLPLPTDFTPKQIKHTSVDGTVEYFLDHSERGAKVFTIDKANNCAILKITKFSTFEVRGTQTYVEPSSGGSISTPTTYAVNVNAATNGAVAADKKTASKGTTVTVTASPSKGYVVDAVKVVDKDGKDVAVTGKDGKYVFTMPASAVTVTGSFKAETPAPVALPFTDVKSGNWFYDAVKYAYAQGLMTGTSATTFAPNGTMNRAMIVTVLYRLEKSPAVTGASKFTDVPAGQWYSDAVAWAAANKIVNGYDETTFGPMNAVTREQMAAILFRYEQVKGLENVTLEENLNRFPDQNKISAYAIPALQWAVGQKIINGNADGTLDPTGTATRAQVAQIFTNLLNK